VGPELRTGPARSVTRREAEVRIYVDADIKGLGLILAALRNDVTYPGDPGAEIHKRQRPAYPITNAAVLDVDWIPVVARRGMVKSSPGTARSSRTETRSLLSVRTTRRWSP
jgi:hypothetical protein